MPRDPQVYLEDILTAIGRIQEFTRGLDRVSFQRDSRTVDAVLHNLEVIGERPSTFPTICVSGLRPSNGERSPACAT